MFQERTDPVVVEGDLVTEDAPRKAGRQSRWETDSIDLKAAIDSSRSASARFVEAFHCEKTRPDRAEELLEQALSQAGLARALLDGFLLRHGRMFVRAEPEDVDSEDASGMPPFAEAEIIEDAKRWRNRSAKNKRYQAQKYRRLRKAKKCVKCTEPAAGGLALCPKCRREGNERDKLARKEANRQKAIAEMAKKMDGR